MRRVGVYGGQFDPPTHAHRAVAVAACSALDLDALHVMVCAKPVHRRARTAFAHRMAMAQRALGDLPDVVVSDLELRLGGPSRMARTLQHVNADEVWLIVGSDQWEMFHTWHRPGLVRAQARIAVVRRGRVSPGLPAPDRWICAESRPMSSTAARSMLAGGGEAGHLVLPEITAYARTHRLYQSQLETNS